MKKKLKFSELNVQSFVTTLTNKENAHIGGGSLPACNVTDAPQDSICYICYAPTANPDGCNLETQIAQDSVCKICYAPTVNPLKCLTNSTSPLIACC